ncbi:MAG: 16S rRNA (uracil(1498)-N(3))-methyltransferase, partial [Bacteroidia bacterium]|nr:16S rRNA (uracil(1498)-N(3))-methyltransferase [Bacteroidia bacterium]
MNNLFYTNRINGNELSLEGQEAAHCALVLRRKAGDIIYVIDGKGNRFKCGTDSVSKRGVECTILSNEHYEQTEKITIAIAPTKNRDRLEWMIEKLVEIGVKQIVLMNTKNTERTRTNMERIEKKVVSAVKQSLRFYIPKVQEMDFEEVLQLEVEEKWIAHCYEDQPKTQQERNKNLESLILIGPEGDFTSIEVQQAFDAGFRGLDLGDYRLRTET